MIKRIALIHKQRMQILIEDGIEIKVLICYSIPKRKDLTSDVILEIWQLIRLLEKGSRAASNWRQEVIVTKYQSRRPMGHHRSIVIGDYGAPPEGLVLPPRARESRLRDETRGRMWPKIPAVRRRTALEKISSGPRRKSHVSSPADCYHPGTIGLISSHIDNRGIGVREPLHLACHQARGETQHDCSEKPMTRPRCTHRFTEILKIGTQDQVLVKF